MIPATLTECYGGLKDALRFGGGLRLRTVRFRTFFYWNGGARRGIYSSGGVFERNGGGGRARRSFTTFIRQKKIDPVIQKRTWQHLARSLEKNGGGGRARRSFTTFIRQKKIDPVIQKRTWQHLARSLEKNGGAGRDRTDDLNTASVALSQLSYGPLFRSALLRFKPCIARGYARQ
jgi:hypothetical protein